MQAGQVDQLELQHGRQPHPDPLLQGLTESLNLQGIVEGEEGKEQ